MFKQFFTISLLILMTPVVHAQGGDIVNDRMQWSNLREICEVGGNTYSTFFHRFEGDTLVDGKTYMKVYISEDEAANFWSFTDELVREENGRVYFRDQYGVEGLIYDFNIQLGEEVTVINTLAPDGLTLMVSKVDSVETPNGYRKRWELILDEFSAPEYWIEGIGSESGVLNSGTGVFLGICGIYYLLCASEDDMQVFQNPDYQTCYYTLLDDGADISSEIKQAVINYLPQSRNVRIDLQAKNDGKAIITNLSGSVLFNSDIHAGISTIDCSSFRPGIYVVTVITSDHLTSAKLFIQ